MLFRYKWDLCCYYYRLDIGQDKIRIGVVTFGNVANTGSIFSLVDCIDQTTLERVGILPQPKGTNAGTATASALAAMIDIFETQGKYSWYILGTVESLNHLAYTKNT